MASGGRELRAAQRASQVVSTAQTPGPSQVKRDEPPTQAKDIRPVCACVFPRVCQCMRGPPESQ